MGPMGRITKRQIVDNALRILDKGPACLHADGGNFDGVSKAQRQHLLAQYKLWAETWIRPALELAVPPVKKKAAK